jgi:hypothetical protein
MKLMKTQRGRRVVKMVKVCDGRESVAAVLNFVKMDFPTDVAEFDNDPRISFSRPDNSYLLETSDGLASCRPALWTALWTARRKASAL